jgi:hypothetical protein
MKNSLKAPFIGRYHSYPAMNRLGTWLGPVIRYIFPKKYVFDAL